MAPRLVITERVNKLPTMGTCSECLHVTFRVSEEGAATSDSLEELQRQFDEHYKKEHMNG
jgi:hypothetical protein